MGTIAIEATSTRGLRSEEVIAGPEECQDLVWVLDGALPPVQTAAGRTRSPGCRWCVRARESGRGL